MSTPVFSVVIPTKNRPKLLQNAVRSVLSQSFSSFEVIVCDNSDRRYRRRIDRWLRSQDDPRLRFIRTDGTLSMGDNWELGCADARGEFVTLLTDRSVFRRHALTTIYREARAASARVVSWPNDHFDRPKEPMALHRRSCSLTRWRLTSDEMISYFLNGDPKFAVKYIPKLLQACCHREVLAEIRLAAGRCFPPVAPDYTSGLLILAHVESVLYLDQSLNVSCGSGNGSDFRARGALADRFLRDLGMDREEMVEPVPSRACFSTALILSDFLRVKELVPERFAGHELNPAQYYVGCCYDFCKAARRQLYWHRDLAQLLAALERESSAVQRAVQAHPYFIKATTTDWKDRSSVELPKAPSAQCAPQFSDVFQAMEWADRNPPVYRAPGVPPMPSLHESAASS